MTRSCGVPYSCSCVLLCCHFVTHFLFPFFFVHLQLLGRILFFVFAKRSPPPPSGCCLNSRVACFRVFAVCTLHDLCHPPAGCEDFSRMPSFNFSYLASFSALSTCYLIPVTCNVPSFFLFGFSFGFRFLVFLCFPVFCLMVRACYPVPQG